MGWPTGVRDCRALQGKACVPPLAFWELRFRRGVGSRTESTETSCRARTTWADAVRLHYCRGVSHTYTLKAC